MHVCFYLRCKIQQPASSPLRPTPYMPFAQARRDAGNHALAPTPSNAPPRTPDLTCPSPKLAETPATMPWHPRPQTRHLAGLVSHALRPSSQRRRQSCLGTHALKRATAQAWSHMPFAQARRDVSNHTMPCCRLVLACEYWHAFALCIHDGVFMSIALKPSCAVCPCDCFCMRKDIFFYSAETEAPRQLR